MEGEKADGVDRDGLICLREFGGTQKRVSEPLRMDGHSQFPLVSPPVSSIHVHVPSTPSSSTRNYGKFKSPKPGQKEGTTTAGKGTKQRSSSAHMHPAIVSRPWTLAVVIGQDGMLHRGRFWHMSSPRQARLVMAGYHRLSMTFSRLK